MNGSKSLNESVLPFGLVEASDFELDESPDDSKVAEKDTNLR